MTLPSNCFPQAPLQEQWPTELVAHRSGSRQSSRSRYSDLSAAKNRKEYDISGAPEPVPVLKDDAEDDETVRCMHCSTVLTVGLMCCLLFQEQRRRASQLDVSLTRPEYTITEEPEPELGFIVTRGSGSRQSSRSSHLSASLTRRDYDITGAAEPMPELKDGEHDAPAVRHVVWFLGVVWPR